jgi:O-acetyl-ADP-ribose deacetylase (regulator of RNase III)
MHNSIAHPAALSVAGIGGGLSLAIFRRFAPESSAKDSDLLQE